MSIRPQRFNTGILFIQFDPYESSTWKNENNITTALKNMLHDEEKKN